jgi:hypothetical protein
MTNSYEHTQKGNPLFYWGIPLIAVVLVLVPFVIIKTAAGKSDSIVISAMLGGLIASLLIMVPVLLFAGVFLSRLTVWMDSDFVRLRFGFGTWRKKFRLDEIQSAAVVCNDWMMGWGIHWIGSGWLYNIAGFDAVELTFKNGKKARIGTDEPEKLAAAIQTTIQPSAEKYFRQD